LAKSKSKKVTPLMKQYFELKAQHKDALLLFRVGDFYETFAQDAITASGVLGIVLTARNNGGSNIELAGFPYHSLDVYLPKLVKAGYRVAICEQLEKPSKEKKIVRRGITDVVTPGIGTDDNLLDQKENNYLAAVVLGQTHAAAVAFLDLSTGDFSLYEGVTSEIAKLISTYAPKEILYSKESKQAIEDLLGEDFYLYGLEDWIWQLDYCRQKLLDLLKVSNLKGYAIEPLQLGQTAAGVILHYLETTQQTNIQHINKISRIQLDRYVWLDQFTIRNLELVSSNHPSGIPLFQILDHTVTPMGGRLLRRWIMLPLTDIPQIETRLSIVSYLKGQSDLSDTLDLDLKKISDLERIIGKVALRKVNPREIDNIKNSLLQIPTIKTTLANEGLEALNTLLFDLDPAEAVVEKIEATIKAEPPVNLAKGGVIATGANEDLDTLRDLIANSKGHLAELLAQETEKTGIANLKVGFNNVFGYYFEVTNKYKNQGLIPDNWTRKQTLTNAERYISEELKTLESSILGAEEKILALETKIYEELIDWLSNYIQTIQRNAQVLSQLDCLNGFAKLALRNNYCKPAVNDTTDINIKAGRHPVIEAHLPLNRSSLAARRVLHPQ